MHQQKNNNPSAKSPRRLSIMGSTGSIGRQTLDIVSHYPEQFAVSALTANSNWQLLAQQAREYHPETVVIANETYYPQLKDSLEDTAIRVLVGEEGLKEAATLPTTDIVVGALVGYSGLPSTIAALEEGKTVALANKETLVVGGEIIEKIIQRKGKRILPVDSEHSAIFQCLWGEEPSAVARIVLTASGGPFRTFSADQLEKVTVQQALRHPNWDMGTKVTIDSATLMNKGFEMIEARWLFDMCPENIRVVVHPESVVHSMVEFTDGSVKAQLGLPDMRVPIAVAIAYPHRLDLLQTIGDKRLNLADFGRLTFEEPDMERFPLLRLAYIVAEKGGLNPAVMNAANEVAVKAFLNQEIGFTDIFSIVTATVEKLESRFAGENVELETIAEAHKEGTEIARQLTVSKF